MSKIDNENDAAIGNKDTAIRINDSYVLFMDRYSLWVIKEAKAKNNKTGKEYISRTKVAGYSRNYEDLLNSFIEGRMRGAKAKNAESHIAKCAKIEKETKAFARLIAKTLNEKRLARKGGSE